MMLRKIFFLILLLFLGIAPNYGAGDGMLLVMGDSYGCPVNKANGQIGGFHVDILEELLNKRGIKYQLIDSSDWDHKTLVDIYLVSSLRGFDTTKYVSSNPYLRLNINYIFRKDNYVEEFGCLKGKHLLVIKTSIVEDYLYLKGISSRITPVDDFQMGIELLKNEDYDAFVTTDRWMSFGSSNIDMDGLVVKSADLPPIHIYLGVRKENPVLLQTINQGLNDLIQSPRYGEIYFKWFGLKNTSAISPIEYITFILGAVLILLLLYIVVKYVRNSRRLRRQLELAISAGDMSVWKYNIKKDFFHRVQGEVLFQEGDSLEKYLELLEPSSRHSFKKAMDSLINGQAKSTEVVVMIKALDSDTYAYIKSRMIAVFKGDKIYAILGARANVTDDIYYREKITYAINKFSSVFNVASVGLEYYDKGGTLIDINEAAMNIFGLSNKEKVLSFKKNLFEDKALRLFKNFKEKSAQDVDYDMSNVLFDYGAPSKKTGIRNLHFELAPHLDSNGEVDCYIISVLDFTENIRLNNSYKQLYKDTRNILSSLPVGIALYNDNGIMTYINQSYMELTGSEADYLNKEHNIHEGLKLFNLNDNLDEIEDYVEYYIDMDFSDPKFNNYFNTKREDQVHIKIRLKPLRDSLGNINSIVSIITDVTDISRAYNEAKKAMKKAEQSDVLKSVFLANMSHEIRTPLNAIVGFSNLLVSAEDKEEREEYGKIISNNSDLLLNLINDILDLSKIEAGFTEFTDELFDINQLYDEVYLSFSLRVREGVQLECIKPSDSLLVFLDSRRFTQVLNNFLSNAVKYTPTGKITFGYQVMDGGIKIYVQDTGIGISEENKAFVFKRFEKLDDFAQGTGLGLSICKALVDVKKGKVGFDSELGKGSTFWAWIPCQMQKNNLLEVEDGNSHSLDSLDKKQLKILIAEDIDSNYILIKAILKGFDLVRAYNGKEAVELCRAEHFDIIFMDMRMPVMDGLAATAAIREFNSEITIVALTANAFDSDRKAAMDAGCNGFITKPVTSDSLMSYLQSKL